MRLSAILFIYNTASADALPPPLDRMSVYEVIDDRKKANDVYKDLADSTEHEALLLLPCGKALLREYKMGVIQSLVNASSRGANVRMICPIENRNKDMINWIIEKAPDFQILDGERSSSTVLVVDGKRHFRAELNMADADEFPDAIGYSEYSNSQPTVDTFRAFFEMIWKLLTLNRDLKKADEMRQQFINIAAHEIRTPIMPILANAELLEAIYQNTQRNPQQQQKRPHEVELLGAEEGGDNALNYNNDDDNVGYQEVEAILRNALRLQRLTEDLLDVARIESQTLELHKEEVNISELVGSVVTDYRKVTEKKIIHNGGNPASNHNSNQEARSGQALPPPHDQVKLTYAEYGNDTGSIRRVKLLIDRFRVSQVLSNLLSNAIRFTKSGEIVVTLQLVDASTTPPYSSVKEVRVSVRDTGEGIDPSIFPRLFEKFSSAGTGRMKTGLGLFISKGIIKAHGGRIWGENNASGKGATFTFTLPT